MKTSYTKRFEITNRVSIITGGGGLLARRHAEAVVEGGGIPVLVDIVPDGMNRIEAILQEEYGADVQVEKKVADITNRAGLEELCQQLVEKYGHIDILVNNAANNPKMEGGSRNLGATRFSDFPLDIWNQDLAVGLTGAMLCAQVFGRQMELQGSGVILNISSDYGIIAPDQRVYHRKGIPEEEQTIKPVSYSVVKHGLIGLTKYLAIYWAEKGIRINTLCPASLENGQPAEFVEKLTKRIPMGRMSKPEEYVCTILYLISDASSYMTGSTVIVDGGRTSW